MTNIMELNREQLFAAIVRRGERPSLAAFRELARKLGIYLHIGSLAIKASPDKAANRSFLIDPHGEIVARYDKIHMFDVDLAGGESYRESRNYRPGELAVLADLPWGRLGLTICYDLRFPGALSRAGGGRRDRSSRSPPPSPGRPARRIGMCCMRARAIENGCFVFAAAQGGKHENGRETFGHSLIVDPWGRILAEGGTEPGVVLAEIDPAEVAAARARIPSLQHGRRFEIVEPMAEPAHLRAVRRRRHDPLRAGLRQGHIRKLVPESAAYDKQAKRGLVTCPVCGSAKVEKAIMAPRARPQGQEARRSRRRPRTPRRRRAAPNRGKTPVAMISPQERELRTKLKELREHLTQERRHVGTKFPEEARKMHYGEIEHRSIYGEASPDEAKELHEEGIEFHPLPVLPDERN